MSNVISWTPLLQNGYTVALLVVAALLILVCMLRRMPDLIWRTVCCLGLLSLILNPVVLQEVRESLPDRIVVVVDRSDSQNLDKRKDVTDQALAWIKSTLRQQGAADPVVIESSRSDEGTFLFSDQRKSFSALPRGQVAGTVLITDGQVHDVPDKGLGALEALGPFHALLTGRKDEFDLKVTIVSAPKYSILRQKFFVTLKVEATGAQKPSGRLSLTVRQDGEVLTEIQAALNVETEIPLTIEHGGQNVFSFSIPAEEGELTRTNNEAFAIVNGVRDHLRVLLVSGSPHMGGRVWRNLLKSDPGIDLVHFTILRSLETRDFTPASEMALISFPVEELFVRKLKDFDLIIFDRFEQFQLMRPEYFRNIADFVRQGGALFVVMDSSHATRPRIFDTDLSDILPVSFSSRLTGSEAPGGYRPTLTEKGRAHPLTAALIEQGAEQNWGSWETQMPLSAHPTGETLMTGKKGSPLLVVSRAEEGRVAVLASDNVWLWAKGGNHQGPYTQLLRNLSHWLMKEPELEKGYMRTEVKDRVITVAQIGSSEERQDIFMTTPQGETRTVMLESGEGAWRAAHVNADTSGVYKFSSGEQEAFAVVGNMQSEEMQDVHATEEKLRPLVDKTGGAMIWLRDISQPVFKTVPASASRFGGHDWIGLKENKSYTVSQVRSHPLIPDAVFLLLLVSLIFISWWKEGRG